MDGKPAEAVADTSSAVTGRAGGGMVKELANRFSQMHGMYLGNIPPGVPSRLKGEAEVQNKKVYGFGADPIQLRPLHTGKEPERKESLPLAESLVKAAPPDVKFKASGRPVTVPPSSLAAKGVHEPTGVRTTSSKEVDKTEREERARVLFEYKAMNDDELSIDIGDVIVVLKKELEDEGWWQGEVNGRVGVFPNNFVKLLASEEEPSVPPKISGSNTPDTEASLGLNSTVETAPTEAVHSYKSQIEEEAIPRITHASPRVLEISNESCLIDWSESASGQCPSDVGFHVQYRRIQGDEDTWMTINTQPLKKSKSRISDLQPETEYEFRVIEDTGAGKSQSRHSRLVKCRTLRSDSIHPDEYNWPKPMCLLQNTGKRLIINKETAAKVAEINDPIVVVAIVGLYRTGKSYLLNRLARKQQGFMIGDAVEAKTKGIWIWCLPHPDRRRCCLALLDTEGLGDTAKVNAAENDTKLFMAATLLCSVLVFNSGGTIDQTSLEKLQFITSMAENLQVRTGGSVDKNDDIHEFCPSFVWVVRDFGLQLVADGEPITSDQYLERALVLRSGTDEAVKKTNRQRTILRRCFLQRKCFTFPPHKPNAKDTTTLKQFDEVVDVFCQYIYKTGHVKAVGGHILNGQKFVSLAEQYADAICSHKVAVVQSAIEAAANSVNEDVIKESVKMYYDAMMFNLVMPVDDANVLEEKHKICEKEARLLFDKRAMLVNEENRKIVEKLAAALLEKYAEICRLDRETSLSKCTVLLEKLKAPINESFKKGDYFKAGGFNAYQADFEKVWLGYNNEPGKGSMSASVLEMYKIPQRETANLIKTVDDKLSETEAPTKEMERQIQKVKEDVEMVKQAQRLLADVKENVGKMEERLREEAKKRAEFDEKVLQQKLEKMLEKMVDERVRTQDKEMQIKRDADQVKIVSETIKLKQENTDVAKKAQAS